MFKIPEKCCFSIKVLVLSLTSWKSPHTDSNGWLQGKNRLLRVSINDNALREFHQIILANSSHVKTHEETGNYFSDIKTVFKSLSSIIQVWIKLKRWMSYFTSTVTDWVLYIKSWRWGIILKIGFNQLLLSSTSWRIWGLQNKK